MPAMWNGFCPGSTRGRRRRCPQQAAVSIRPVLPPTESRTRDGGRSRRHMKRASFPRHSYKFKHDCSEEIKSAQIQSL
jgi:hypothetical protein